VKDILVAFQLMYGCPMSTL